MNISQAKETSINAFMQTMGYEPIRSAPNGWVVYYPPYREERTPSFGVNEAKGSFHDFGGSGLSGDIIDLSSEILKSKGRSHTTSEALNYIEQQVGNPSLSTTKYKPVIPKKNDANNVVINSIKPIETNQILMDYATSTRSINPIVAKNHLKAVYWKFDDKNKPVGNSQKQYFSLGFKNNSEGFELRNAIDGSIGKVSTQPKDITFFKGNSENGISEVYEAGIDFMSKITQRGQKKAEVDTYILNGASMLDDKLIKKLKEEYSRINVFSDNDIAGTSVYERIREYDKVNYPDVTVNDSRKSFQLFKDVNEQLTNHNEESLVELRGFSDVTYPIDRTGDKSIHNRTIVVNAKINGEDKMIIAHDEIADELFKMTKNQANVRNFGNGYNRKGKDGDKYIVLSSVKTDTLLEIPAQIITDKEGKKIAKFEGDIPGISIKEHYNEHYSAYKEGDRIKLKYHQSDYFGYDDIGKPIHNSKNNIETMNVKMQISKAPTLAESNHPIVKKKSVGMKI